MDSAVRGGVDAFVALGSNLGRREAAVLEAVRRLETDGAARVVRLSSLYETEPVDMEPARRFINALVQVRTLLSPTDLLIRLKTIEKRMGREGGHNAPREIDLDMVAYGREVREGADLTLPHPRYDVRAFVLVPLREVAPGFECPRTGRSVDTMIELLAHTRGVVRVCGRGVIPREQS